MTYKLPDVWTWDDENENVSGNRPTAGARFDQVLPKGDAPFQLYSLGTPNGIKVTVMFEELKELKIKDADYDLFLINIGEGDQFGSDFVELNPNSKIPALLDTSVNPALRIFESVSILLYLAENLMFYYLQTYINGQKSLIGYSGKRERHLLLVVASAISSTLPLKKSSMPLTALQWKLNVNSTY